MAKFKYLTMREIKKTKHTEAIKDRFLSGANDITAIVRVKVLSASHKRAIKAGLAEAKASGTVLGRPNRTFKKLKKGDKRFILEELDKGIPQARIMRTLKKDIGLKISKATMCRLVKKLKQDQ